MPTTPASTTVDVLVIGNAAIDYIFVADRYPVEDSKGSANELNISRGGQGANMAWVLARLGLRCALATSLGDDAHGDAILQDLRQQGVDTGLVQRRKGGTTAISIVVSSLATNSRTCLHFKGGVAPLCPDDMPAGVEILARVLLTDTRFGDASAASSRRVKEAGGHVVLASEHRKCLTPTLTESADVVIVPKDIVADGGRSHGVEAMACDLCRDLRTNCLVMTLGQEGCLLVQHGRPRRIPACNRPVVVDTLGAGDAFAAALCYGVLRMGTMDDACLFANAVASLSCGGIGLRAGCVPDADEADALAKTLLERPRTAREGGIQS